MFSKLINSITGTLNTNDEKMVKEPLLINSVQGTPIIVNPKIESTSLYKIEKVTVKRSKYKFMISEKLFDRIGDKGVRINNVIIRCGNYYNSDLCFVGDVLYIAFNSCKNQLNTISLTTLDIKDHIDLIKITMEAIINKYKIQLGYKDLEIIGDRKPFETQDIFFGYKYIKDVDVNCISLTLDPEFKKYILSDVNVPIKIIDTRQGLHVNLYDILIHKIKTSTDQVLILPNKTFYNVKEEDIKECMDYWVGKYQEMKKKMI